MTDFASASNAIIATIEKKAKELEGDNWNPLLSAPALLQLAQAYAALHSAGK